MTILPIVDRELRVASRRPSTHWLRFALGLGVLLLWNFLLVMAPLPGAALRGQVLFGVLGALALGFCLLAGVFLTADCLSAEKREGTLGLLFLTQLKGYDVALGKLVANSLHATYGLLVILPVLALPLLMGGVTAGQFWRVSLALLLILWLSLATGLLVSTWSRDTRAAMATTLVLLAGLTALMPLLSAVAPWLFKGKVWRALAWPSPSYLYLMAFDSRFQSRQGWVGFWGSLSTISVLTGAALTLACVQVSGVWQERAAPQTGGGWGRWWLHRRLGSEPFRLARREQLAENPFCWLGTRNRLPRLAAWGVLVALIPAWLGFVAACFSGAAANRAVGFYGVVWLAFAMHQGLKWLVAFEASRRLWEDRDLGTLELLRVTPLPVEELVSGQRRALRDMFRGPLLVLLLLNAVLFWLLLLVNPMRWPTSVLAVGGELCLGGAIMLLVDFHALSSVGMWLGLRARGHPRAVLSTLARVLVTPWLAVALVVLITMGGQGLSLEVVQVLSLVWFGLAAVIEFTFAARARLELTEALESNSFQLAPDPAASEWPAALLAAAEPDATAPTISA